MNTCITCGMPFEGDHANDVGFQSELGPVCTFDSEHGAMKSPDVIFQGGVAFFSGVAGGDRELAERLTRSNMKSLPYWQAHHFAELDGPEATPEEFQSAMAKL